MTNYEREFKFSFGKNYYLFLLLMIPILFGAIFYKNDLSENQTLLFVLFILITATVLGYLLAYKKVIFSYCDNFINIAFKGGYFSLRNKEYNINIAEIAEYKERKSYKGCGYMQFVMKDASIIEIAYSPYVDTYVELRSEILDVLSENNIKRTCVL